MAKPVAGDVVVLPLPQTNLQPGKRRPALVVVDLTGDVQSAHPGRSLNELLTVYTMVDALTENMPALTAVQVLVDGKEVETLAGHVDLRRPLAKNLTWIDETRNP